jgi:hypothetical protein
VLAPSLLGVDVRFLCTKCRTKLKVDARLGGKELACPQCGTTVLVPQWHGSPDEIVEQGEKPSQVTRPAGIAPAVTLSPEELAFLQANQEVG